jgi:hypothetical protein
MAVDDDRLARQAGLPVANLDRLVVGRFRLRQVMGVAGAAGIEGTADGFERPVRLLRVLPQSRMLIVAALVI